MMEVFIKGYEGECDLEVEDLPGNICGLPQTEQNSLSLTRHLQRGFCRTDIMAIFYGDMFDVRFDKSVLSTEKVRAVTDEWFRDSVYGAPPIWEENG
jgi:hypothetical protein